MAKTAYLSDDQCKMISEIRPYFKDDHIEPTDGMIISAALTVYIQFLESKKKK